MLADLLQLGMEEKGAKLQASQQYLDIKQQQRVVAKYTELLCASSSVDLGELYRTAASAEHVLSSLREVQLPADVQSQLPYVLRGMYAALLEGFEDSDANHDDEEDDDDGGDDLIWAVAANVLRRHDVDLYATLDKQDAPCLRAAVQLAKEQVLLDMLRDPQLHLQYDDLSTTQLSTLLIVPGVDKHLQAKQQDAWRINMWGATLHDNVAIHCDNVDAALQRHFDKQAAAAAIQQQQQQQPPAVGHEEDATGADPSSSASQAKPQSRVPKQQQQQQAEVMWYVRTAATQVLVQHWLPNADRMGDLWHLYDLFRKGLKGRPADEAAIQASLGSTWSPGSRMFSSGMLATCAQVSMGL